MPDSNDIAVKVWDVPVRLFHWVLVGLFAFQFASGKIGGNLMEWHMYAGYGVLALVLFRVMWGFAGSTHARFASFLAGPAACVRFARRLLTRSPALHAGHNPLGGWMVLALLVLLAAQASSGLFANDDIATEGPLAALVSKDLSDWFTVIHKSNAYALLVLVVTHIAAVLYHWLGKKENLIGAMFTGVKRLPGEVVQQAASARFVGSGRALVLLAAAIAAVYVIVKRPF